MELFSVITSNSTKTFTGPFAWPEVTPKQYLEWVRWQTTLQGDAAVRFFLLVHWYGVPRRLLEQMTDEHRERLARMLDWSLQVPDCWKLESLFVGANRYVGPGDRLKWLTFGEYMFADNAARRRDLPALAAALYRPIRRLYMTPTAYNRTPFHPATLERQTKAFARLPTEVLDGIFLNYLGATEHFASSFPHLCKPAPADSDAGSNWLEVGISLARQTSALGSFHEIERTNLFLVLRTLDSVLADQEKIEAASRKTTPDYAQL